MEEKYLDREIIGVKVIKDNKEEVLRLRIEKAKKDAFVKLCKSYGTTPSDTLRRYIFMSLRSQQL